MPVSAPEMTSNSIQEGDVVLLWFMNDKTYLVEVTKGKKLSIHCGRPLEVEEWIGKEYGAKLECQHDVAFLLNPTMDDLMMKATRESGVIYPKDAAFLMMKTGIRSGSKVLEVGTGSGSLTMALAQAVAPTGRVHTFDRREDLPKNAVKNVNRAGLKDFVTFHQRVAAEPFPEKDFDVVVLDIPTPWEELEVVKEALKGGGRLASLNPTFNQIERMSTALTRSGFIRMQCVELLERGILAREGKTRPVQRMVSHTEFMLFATFLS